MTALPVTLAVICILTLLMRDGYELLKMNGRVDPTDTRLFITVFAAMLVMWATWFALGFVSPAGLGVPQALRWAGLVAVVAGVGTVLSGMWTLRGVENIDHLVTHGLFSRLRHPMYLGFALWVVGWTAFAATTANLLIAPLALASIAWWRHLEERDLTSRYGEDYVAYRATTWI